MKCDLDPALRGLRLVREREVASITGLSRTRRHELIKLGRFPPKVQISERASGWRLRDIVDWRDSRPLVGDDGDDADESDKDVP